MKKPKDSISVKSYLAGKEFTLTEDVIVFLIKFRVRFAKLFLQILKDYLLCVEAGNRLANSGSDMQS